jgi:adenylate kinase
MSGNPESQTGRPLILLGPPGAGKGTQAAEIAKRLAIPHISTGAIFRENVRQGTQLGLLAKGLMERGELVPDDVVNGMVRDRLRQADCARGFLLDGYPRTVAQAREFRAILTEMRRPQPVVVNLRVGYHVIVKRLSGRRTCPACQRIYNLHSQPPLRDTVCDADGAALVQRADDREEAIHGRLAAYERETAPVVDFYRNEGVLLEVNGEQSPSQIQGELARLLACV